MKLLKYSFLIVFLSIHALSIAAPEKKPLAIDDLPDFTIPKGQVVYQRYCLFCHGKTGQGDGQNSFSLKTRPADLRLILPEHDEKQLLSIIQLGGAEKGLSPAMPTFAHTLSDIQIKQLIMYIKRFPDEH